MRQREVDARTGYSGGAVLHIDACARFSMLISGCVDDYPFESWLTVPTIPPPDTRRRQPRDAMIHGRTPVL
jgi:hypothetical protein